MKDTDLDELTTEELFYLKDEWNEAYKQLAIEFNELQEIHKALSEEFAERGISFEVDNNTEKDEDDGFEHNSTIH